MVDLSNAGTFVDWMDLIIKGSMGEGNFKCKSCSNNLGGKEQGGGHVLSKISKLSKTREGEIDEDEAGGVCRDVDD